MDDPAVVGIYMGNSSSVPDNVYPLSGPGSTLPLSSLLSFDPGNVSTDPNSNSNNNSSSTTTANGTSGNAPMFHLAGIGSLQEQSQQQQPPQPQPQQQQVPVHSLLGLGFDANGPIPGCDDDLVDRSASAPPVKKT